jgi:hypothetical protein
MLNQQFIKSEIYQIINSQNVLYRSLRNKLNSRVVRVKVTL